MLLLVDMCVHSKPLLKAHLFDWGRSA